MRNIQNVAQKIEKNRPFTEREAWWLFRAAALAEAIGWTLLIIAVTARHFGWSWQSYAIPIAGRLHGTFFIAYFLISLAVYSSLRWPRWQFGVAIVAGIPPYGSLVFEQVVARVQAKRAGRRFYSLQVYCLLVSDGGRAYTTGQ